MTWPVAPQFAAAPPSVAQILQSSRGQLFVLSGPSGSGKTTLIDELFKQPDMTSQFSRIPSVKTRLPRNAEELHSSINRFVSHDEFRRLIDTEQMLEWDEYNGHLYGKAMRDVLPIVSQGHHGVMELTAKKALELKARLGDKLKTIFIAPPKLSLEALRVRLFSRATESVDAIERRLTEAAEEMKLMPRFDHVIESVEGLVQLPLAQLRAYLEEQTKN